MVCRCGVVVESACLLDAHVVRLLSVYDFRCVSTVEVEIVALAHSCHELFPIMDGVSIMGKPIGLPVGNTTIQVLNHKDNAGAFVLAKTLSPKFTFQSKHYPTKTI